MSEDKDNINLADITEKVSSLAEWFEEEKHTLLGVVNYSPLKNKVTMFDRYNLSRYQKKLLYKLLNENDAAITIVDYLTSNKTAVLHKDSFSGKDYNLTKLLHALSLCKNYLSVYPYNRDKDFQNGVYHKVIELSVSFPSLIENVLYSLNNFLSVDIIKNTVLSKTSDQLLDYNIDSFIHIQKNLKTEENKMDMLSKSLVGSALLGASLPSVTAVGAAAITPTMIKVVGVVSNVLPVAMVLPIAKVLSKMTLLASIGYGVNKGFGSVNKNYRLIVDGVGKNYINFISIKAPSAEKDMSFKASIIHDLLTPVMYAEKDFKLDRLSAYLNMSEDLYNDTNINKTHELSTIKSLVVRDFFMDYDLPVNYKVLLFNIDKFLNVNNEVYNSTNFEEVMSLSLTPKIVSFMNSKRVSEIDKKMMLLVLDLAMDEKAILENAVVREMLDSAIEKNKLNVSVLGKAVFGSRASIFKDRHAVMSDDFVGYLRLAYKKTKKYSFSILNKDVLGHIDSISTEKGYTVGSKIVELHSSKIMNKIKPFVFIK